jgi:hypothetical protein
LLGVREDLKLESKAMSGAGSAADSVDPFPPTAIECAALPNAPKNAANNIYSPKKARILSGKHNKIH